jgi:hypothetical protein
MTEPGARHTGAEPGGAGEPVYASWLGTGGEMAERLRSYDRALTSAGAIDDWPQSLRTALQLVMQLRQPAALCVGPEATLLYNDEYRDLLGRKHPDALGKPFLAVWPELADFVAPVVSIATTMKPPTSSIAS